MTPITDTTKILLFFLPPCLITLGEGWKPLSFQLQTLVTTLNLFTIYSKDMFCSFFTVNIFSQFTRHKSNVTNKTSELQTYKEQHSRHLPMLMEREYPKCCILCRWLYTFNINNCPVYFITDSLLCLPEPLVWQMFRLEVGVTSALRYDLFICRNNSNGGCFRFNTWFVQYSSFAKGSQTECLFSWWYQ